MTTTNSSKLVLTQASLLVRLSLLDFTHDADGDTTTGDSGNDVVTGSDPGDGVVQLMDSCLLMMMTVLTVSFEFSEDETVVGSALIRWNIGEVQWLEASYPAAEQVL